MGANHRRLEGLENDLSKRELNQAGRKESLNPTTGLLWDIDPCDKPVGTRAQAEVGRPFGRA